MDLMQLRYFCVLARLEHMTRTAEALHVAQPALSRSLRNLEAELGVPLFDRVGKGLRLNSHGRLLLGHCETALGELDTARESLRRLREENDRQVSLTMLAGSKLLPEIIRGFKALYPGISLQIIQQPESGAMPDGSDITVDAVLEVPQRGNMVTLLREEIDLAMPRANPLSGAVSIQLSQVADQPFICLYRGKSLRTITDACCQQAGFEPNIALESDSPGTVRELIALGVGLAFIPRVTWQGVGDDRGVILVPITEPSCFRHIVMSWPEGRPLSKAALALRTYLMDFFTKRQP